MELQPNHIVCACRNKNVLDVLNYVEDNKIPRTNEQLDILLQKCKIGQSCMKCVTVEDYERIDVDIFTVLENI